MKLLIRLGSKRRGYLLGEFKEKGHGGAHHHHAVENQRQWGSSDHIEWIEKPDMRTTTSGKRIAAEECRNSLLNRLCIGYNMAAFIKKPVLHQYMQDGRIYRLAEERLSSKFELFFDLLFIGAVHQMSDAAAESPNGLGFVKYVLTFAPAFSVWSDVRDLMNQMGVDDVSQRLYILWIMALLVGYSINATAIDLGILTSADRDTESEEFRQSQLALQYAKAFFCVAKISRVAISALNSWFLARARLSILVTASYAGFMSLCFFIAIWLAPHSIAASFTLVSLAILLEWIAKFLAILALKIDEWTRRKKREKGELDESRKGRQYPSVNIEHHVERLGAFVTIVLGEMVLNIFFHTELATGLNDQFGKAVLGLMLAFNLNWLYFDSGGTANYLHAIRRHWFSGYWFTALHSPLCGALLLGSSSISHFVTAVSSAQGLAWFFGAGIGTSIIMMATIGTLHKVLEVPHRGFNAARRVILATRYLAGLTMILLPLAYGKAIDENGGEQEGKTGDGLNNLQFMGIYTGITVFLIVEELVMRLEKAEVAD